MEGAVNATTDNFSTLIMETASHGVESLSDGIKELEDVSAELDSWAFKEDVETVMVIKFTMPLNWLVSQDVPETKNGLTVGVNASLDTIWHQEVNALFAILGKDSIPPLEIALLTVGQTLSTYWVQEPVIVTKASTSS